MPTNDRDCPCEAVKALQAIVQGHDKQLAESDKNFAVVALKLDTINVKLDKKDKFNSGIVTSIVNGILVIIIGYIAVKLGIA